MRHESAVVDMRAGRPARDVPGIQWLTIIAGIRQGYRHAAMVRGHCGNSHQEVLMRARPRQQEILCGSQAAGKAAWHSTKL